MRILCATPYYEPEGGGLEHYARAILTRLAARGHQVQVATMTRQALPSYQAGSTSHGVHVHRTRARLELGHTPIDPRYRRLLDHGIQEFDPDVIVAHCPVPFAAETAYKQAARRGIPFVTTYHAGRLHGSNILLETIAHLLDATIEQRMFHGSAGLIAVSPFVRDNALAAHRDRTTIIPPGVDAQQFTPPNHDTTNTAKLATPLPTDPPSPPKSQAPSKPTKHDAPSILFVAPLSRSYRWKGIDTLCHAFETIRQRIPNATLELVGTGDRLPEFQRLAHASGDTIHLHPRLNQEQLVAAYQQASVLALPSTTDAESFGMVLAEANACGTPVVASNIGGIPDFVRHGDNGLLAQPSNPQDLAKKLLAILQDPDEAHAMGKRGRARVLQHHNWDHITQATEQVLGRAATTQNTP